VNRVKFNREAAHAKEYRVEVSDDEVAAGAVTSTSVALSWAASTDDVGVGGYDVLRAGLPVATSSSRRSPRRR
jgi:hypothetical protein